MTEALYPKHASVPVLQLQLWMLPPVIRTPTTINVVEQRR